MKFYAHHFFRTLRIFYVKMATSEEVGGDGYADKMNSLRLKKKKMNKEINSLSWEFEIMKQKLMIFEIYWSM